MENNPLLANVPVDLLYQALETEKGGVQIYSTALRCAVNKDLKEEWNEYLEQTKTHVQIVTDILRALALDPDAETPGRKVVRYIGTSLVKAMEMALKSADPQAAQTESEEITEEDCRDRRGRPNDDEVADRAPVHVDAGRKAHADDGEDEDLDRRGRHP